MPTLTPGAAQASPRSAAPMNDRQPSPWARKSSTREGVLWLTAASVVLNG